MVMLRLYIFSYLYNDIFILLLLSVFVHGKRLTLINQINISLLLGFSNGDNHVQRL